MVKVCESTTERKPYLFGGRFSRLYESRTVCWTFQKITLVEGCGLQDAAFEKDGGGVD